MITAVGAATRDTAATDPASLACRISLHGAFLAVVCFPLIIGIAFCSENQASIAIFSVEIYHWLILVNPIDKHRASTSSYRRSPRPSFFTRAYKQLKRLLRDLVYYAKRHPVKVFTLVILPLITGGALTALLARFGLRLPPGLERMLGMGARAMSGSGIGLVGEAVRMASGMGGGGREGSTSIHMERDSWQRDIGGGFGGFGGSGGGGGWGGGVMKSVREFFD